MKQNIELEYKMLLSGRQFNTIRNRYPFGFPIKQTNYYYDTKNLALGTKRYALRIREVDHQFLLTLKIPQKVGVLELEQPVSSHELVLADLNPEIQGMLAFIAEEQLVLFGALTTYRSVHETENAIICLDENFYHGSHDYEIEYEVKKEHDSYETFKQFLLHNGIYMHRPAMGKARRVKQAVGLVHGINKIQFSSKHQRSKSK